MSSPLARVPEELAGGQAGPGASSPVLPNGPGYPRIVQAWLWLKRPTWFLDRCSRAYGDVFTMRLPMGINMVHIARPELVKAVFGGDNDVLRAGEANATILEPLVGPHSVLVLDGPEHLRQRKLILPAFHGDRMRAWEASVREITQAEIARWPVGRPFALRPSMQSITLDVIVRVVFGVGGSARGDELRRRIRTLTAIGRNPFLLFATRDRRLGSHAPWARFTRARDALSAALTEEIRQRRHAPDLEQRSDVLSQLLLARDDEGRAMTDDEVRDELVTLLFAGHETTATALAWAFDLLLHDPRALGRLVAELDSGASEYLDATITETLRVRPVIAVVDRHVRQAVRIGGHAIPAGVIRVPQHLPRPAARGPLPGPPPRSGRTGSSARGPRLSGGFPCRRRHPAVPGCQLRHLRDADRPSRGAARRDASARFPAASQDPPGSSNVRPPRWRALRRDRPDDSSRSWSRRVTPAKKQ